MANRHTEGEQAAGVVAVLSDELFEVDQRKSPPALRAQQQVELLGRGIAWLDTGTHEALLQAANFIEAVQQRQGLRISCPEEIGWRNGWLDDDQLRAHATALAKNDYGEYLLSILDQPGPP